MPLIHPRISFKEPKKVIEEMLALKARRFRGLVDRREFLLQWHELRIDLEATQAYEEFRQAVIARSGGRCERIVKGERCKRKGKHVHHKKQMSYHPELALTVSNGEHVCVQCHQASHKHKIRS